MPANPHKCRCAFDTRHGKPCRAYAVRGSDPPACAAHAGLTTGAGAPAGNRNARTHGFYSRALVALALQATRTIARLLRDRRAISGESADGISGAIAQALDELSTEWGIEL